ncbi:MAG: hypothetical protein HQK51_21010, partial [Oligoflexia bacterium]|nr:hypothetical protein [Oligoflexia bacterium]
NLDDIIIDTPYKNLRLICGGNDKIDYNQIKQKSLISEIKKISVNFVIIDLGAGLNDEMIDLYNLADEKIMVVTPQLISLQNAYSFIKAAFCREVEKNQKMAVCLRHLKNDIARLVVAINNLEDSHLLKNELKKIALKQRFWIMPNMVQEENNIIHISRLKELIKEYVEIESAVLGSIRYSNEIQSSVSRMIPFVVSSPQSDNSKQLRKIAFNLFEYSK